MIVQQQVNSKLSENYMKERVGEMNIHRKLVKIFSNYFLKGGECK